MFRRATSLVSHLLPVATAAVLLFPAFSARAQPGPERGLRNAYCAAMHCQNNPNADPDACFHVGWNYQRLTGQPLDCGGNGAPTFVISCETCPGLWQQIEANMLLADGQNIAFCDSENAEGGSDTVAQLLCEGDEERLDLTIDVEPMPGYSDLMCNEGDVAYVGTITSPVLTEDCVIVEAWETDGDGNPTDQDMCPAPEVECP